MKFEVPEGLPIMTIEEIRKGNGKDGNPTYFTLNGKVREYNLEGYKMGDMMK
jgi:predicted heme/steroid binding protein